MSSLLLIIPILLIPFIFIIYENAYSATDIIYAGIYSKPVNPSGYAFHVFFDWGEFTDKINQLNAKNIQSVDIEVVRVDDKMLYAVVGKGSGKAEIKPFNTLKQVFDDWEQSKAQSRRLIEVESYKEPNGQKKFAALYELGATGSTGLFRHSNFDNFNSNWKILHAQGYRLSGVEKDGNSWISVFRGGSGGQYFWASDSWPFRDFYAKMRDKGYAAEAWGPMGTTYANYGAFRPDNGEEQYSSGEEQYRRLYPGYDTPLWLDWESFTQEWNKKIDEGFRLKLVSVCVLKETGEECSDG